MPMPTCLEHTKKNPNICLGLCQDVGTRLLSSLHLPRVTPPAPRSLPATRHRGERGTRLTHTRARVSYLVVRRRAEIGLPAVARIRLGSRTSGLYVQCSSRTGRARPAACFRIRSQQGGASAFVSVAPFTAAGERGLARPIAHSTARSAHEKPKRRCLGQRSPSGGRSLTPRDPRPSARPARARGHKLRPGARVRRGVQGWVPTRRAARPRERCAQKNGDVRLPPTLAGNAGALAPLLLTDTCTQHAHRCPCAWRDPRRLGAAGARGGRQQSADCTPRRVRACSFTRNGASWRRSPPPSRRRAAPLPPSGRPWRTHVPAGVLWRRVRRLGRRRRREAVVVVVLEQREARAVGELGLRIGTQTASEAASVSEAASERSPGEGAGVCTKPTTSKRTN